MLALREETGTAIVSPDHALLASKDLVDQLHRAGFRVVPWTVNEPDRMRELVAFGVDGLITDPSGPRPWRSMRASRSRATGGRGAQT